MELKGQYRAGAGGSAQSGIGRIAASTKTYRFFFHYHRASGGMTVHFRGRCTSCKNVVCSVATESKWNKQQPRLVMQGFASEVEEANGTVIIR